jgi:hypothetical protein
MLKLTICRHWRLRAHKKANTHTHTHAHTQATDLVQKGAMSKTGANLTTRASLANPVKVGTTLRKCKAKTGGARATTILLTILPALLSPMILRHRVRSASGSDEDDVRTADLNEQECALVSHVTCIAAR